MTPSPTTPIKTPYVTPSLDPATSDEDKDVDKIVDLVRHVVNVQRDMGQTVTINQLDKIYDRCRSKCLERCATIASSPTRSLQEWQCKMYTGERNTNFGGTIAFFTTTTWRSPRCADAG